ncbi:MAG: TetR/AcrR family transcriptional regulator [Actinomycetota bacterium]|nr:TetR/AcrR family transcriptional regulator [Actinomycetota bacterium]
MVTGTSSTTHRRSAGERREDIIAEAIRHFARSGYNAASTEAIARDAGISQPYLFRLFGTKKELFLACHQRVHERVVAAFRRAAEGLDPSDRLMAMGGAYIELLADRDALLFQMQSYAACADPEIRERVRGRYVELIRDVREISEAGPADVWLFCSTGMLLNVIASLDLEAVAGEEPWLAQWLAPAELVAELRGDARKKDDEIC